MQDALHTGTQKRTVRRYDGVLMDMGYTLVHFEPETPVIFQRALRAAGSERSLAEIEAANDAAYAEETRDAATATFPATPDYDHHAQRSHERAVLARLGVPADPVTLDTFTTALRSWFDRPGVVRPYPEVLSVLAALRERGYRLGIVSNWSWNLRQRVAQVEMGRFFEVVWASAYAGCNKPHPTIFRQALAQMQPAVPPDRALYVGDSYWYDVVGARSAGLTAALLDRHGTADTPDCPVISDLWGVLDLLEG
jgi:HAD superfamily hydrolase (TIGR01549 family)